MTVLFRTPYGSALYGTFTPDSDTDYVTVYLPDITDVLVGNLPQRVREKSTNTGDGKNSASDVDEKFVTVQKFASDFYEGKQYAVEVAFAAMAAHMSTIDKQFQYLAGWLVHQVVSTRALLSDEAVEGLIESARRACVSGDHKKAYSNLRLVTTSIELRSQGYLAFPMLSANRLRAIKRGECSIEDHVEFLQRMQKTPPVGRLFANYHLDRKHFNEELARHIRTMYFYQDDL